LEVIKEIEIGNCTIVFVEQPVKSTDKSINNLHKAIADLLLSEQK